MLYKVVTICYIKWWNMLYKVVDYMLYKVVDYYVI